MNKEEICDNLGYWVKLNKSITRKQAEDTLDFILEQGNEIEKLNSIIETTKIFVEKYNDKPFDIELRKMILKCLNDELKGEDKE